MNSVDFLFEVVCNSLALNLIVAAEVDAEVIWRYFSGQLGEDDSEVLILFERGKRKTMEGNRVKFKGWRN